MIKAIAFLVLGLGFSAQAGKVKDIHFTHEREVALHVWGTEEANPSEIKNTRFVKAAPGSFVAMASEALVYNPKTQKLEWITCTTQFVKTEAQNVKPVSVYCTRTLK